ncbi:unnamed protein product [Allacma fusca]|uniref:Uncharacterized protein n=1 Tax=Allacma fusca TaxID=39272 RepID=A0A8J2NY61_9HEXA|nr:unnamed protein product [Allacma fusca]
MEEKNARFIVTVYVGSLSEDFEALSVEASKHTTAEEIVSCIVQKLGFPNPHEFELAEVIGNSFGQECKERRISSYESPVALKLLWPKIPESADTDSLNSKSWASQESASSPGPDCYRFCLREKLTDTLWNESFVKDTQFIRDYFYRFHFQPKDKEYPDLCQLPDLNESTLLESLKSRFTAGHIYTYVGSILIAVNPFKFYPIYNPKYVKLYQNRRREELPPHIFAIADSAYHTMLKEKKNQCIVISGESGSGKTESTNFLLHHLTALSQKGTHGSGVEQTILSAGPVLEAFGNAKTAHNNNSSRFGKFIQVSYRENGMVHGSIVQKFLLEKSRICCQAPNERNYHVFYYLLAGASDTEKENLNLLPPYSYHYLNQSGCYTLDGVDESYEFSRLKQSMEMVGFGADKQRKLFNVLSAVLLLGNVKFLPKKSSYRDESVLVKNPEVVSQISSLLRVTQGTLLASLTSKRARVSGEMLVINYRMAEAIAARDAMAKCLYGSLFDWIVLQLNHALLSKKGPVGNDARGNSIGVLDIFGFEDFQNCNSFEQYCINYANEHLQHYFNQHVFKYEQEEYKKEGIRWTNIEFLDNSKCLSLIEAKPNGLICILDDQCNFPGATNETLLQKFNSVHKEHRFYEVPQKREAAFVICHYAGKVKYQVIEFREKNMDLMRHDIVSVLKNSSCAFVRELVGIDPVAVFRWAILRAFFRAYFAFHDAGRKHRANKENRTLSQVCSSPGQRRSSVSKDNLVKKARSFRSQASLYRGLKTLRSVKTLASHLAAIGVSNKHYNPRKQPISVSQQFQQSLHSLMVTLNQANPFFIRCIKSNSEKIPNVFDNSIVQRQLRYTGMLETVRIRQAGYNVRLNFDEFIHLYRILLPKGLKSEREDVEALLLSLNLNPSNYQLGEHKVFLRESEKIKLDYFLHQQILSSITCIQRWYRSILERRHFLHVQHAVVTIQSYVRMFLAQKFVANLRMMNLAATYIQKIWRGHRVRKWYQNLRSRCVQFQARVRGNIIRQQVAGLLEQRRKLSKERENTEVIFRKESADRLDIYDSQHDIFSKRNSKVGIEELDGVNSTSINPPKEYAEDVPLFVTSPLRKEHRSDISLPDELMSAVHYDEADDNANLFDLNAKKDKSASTKTPSSSKNPFHRAKKHIKTIMISGGNSKTKLEKHEATLLESGSEAEENENVFPQEVPGSSSKSKPCRKEELKSKNKNSSSKQSTFVDVKSSSSLQKPDLQLRQTKSLQTMTDVSPTKHSDSAIGSTNINRGYGTIDVTRSANNTEPLFDQSYHASLGRPKLDRKVQLFDGSLVNNGFESQRLNQKSRRESEGIVSVNSLNHRRSSRDSAQSYTGSPSMSSQDSLFFNMNTTSVNGPLSPGQVLRDKPLPQRLSTSTSEYSIPESSVLGTSAQKSRKQSLKFETQILPSPVDSFTGRDIRRTRSVSESRGSNGNIAQDFSNEEQSLSKSKLGASPSETDDYGVGKSKRNGYHVLEKNSKFHRGDSCGACKKNMHAVFSPGYYKCLECHLYFHDKCIQSGAIMSHVCEYQNRNFFFKTSRSKSETIGRRLKRKQSKSQTDVSKPKFSLTGTSEFTDAADQIISDWRELQKMQEFISAKIYQVTNKESGKSSKVDKVFEQALREFKESLVSTFSVASKQGGMMQLNITYKDLISYFANIMETVCKQEGIGSDFPTTMGVNALRGFLNEFMNDSRLEEKPKVAKNRKKVKRSKRQKVEESISYLGHSFVAMVVYIPTACEICSSFIMWPIERGVVCQKCKLACHKKCHPKLQIECNEGRIRGTSDSNESGIFGVPLSSLVPENGTVPLIVDQLITVIEFYGLRQEGLYRKSGVSSSVRELKNEFKEGKQIDWEAFSPHVFTSVLKSFFRELPEPLLTFELYDEFLRAADLSLLEDRIQTIFAILKKLPKPNYDLMERLIFHLVRVALYEDKNRMNANSLAIVFAPCILRTNKCRQAQESLTDVSRQTQCIETIISEQLKKVKATLSNIESVDSAAFSFSFRLHSLRNSKLPSERRTHLTQASSKKHSPGRPDVHPFLELMTPEEEEAYLQRHIRHLQNEKAMLALVLPSLSRTPSDDEMLSTDPEVDSSAGSVDDLHRDGISSPKQGHAHSSKLDTFMFAPCQECLSSGSRASASSLLPHNVIKTKNRGPVRKPPSRFVRNQFHPVNFGEDEAEDCFDCESDPDDSKDQSNDEDEGAIMV